MVTIAKHNAIYMNESVCVYMGVSLSVYVGVHACVRACVRACNVCVCLWAIKVSNCTRIYATITPRQRICQQCDILLYFVCYFQSLEFAIKEVLYDCDYIDLIIMDK